MWLLANTRMNALKIEAFIDNNPTKVGKMLYGKRIISVEELKQDVPILICAMKYSADIENQIKQVDNMLSESRYQDEDSQYKLNTIKEGLTKQKELAEEEMTNAFERGIKQTQNYQQQASLAKADVGNRMNRLNLTKSRLTEQKTNFTKLKSENEDIDLEEVVINYTAAELVYNASLTAASKVVQQTLLDFL